MEKSVGDAKEIGHLKARMKELETNEKEREKAMASGEIEALRKTLGDKLRAEKARVQVQLKASRCVFLLLCVSLVLVIVIVIVIVILIVIVIVIADDFLPFFLPGVDASERGGEEAT